MVDFALTTRAQDGTTFVALAGELDLHRVPALAEALRAASGHVLVDLQEVTFLDSTTLALLVQEHRRMQAAGRELTVLVGEQTPTTVFAITGIDRILTIRSAEPPSQDADPRAARAKPPTAARERARTSLGAASSVTSAVETAARNQVVCRDVNERIAELTGLLNETGVNLLICECSDSACAESLEITLQEYAAVRANPARFVVRQGHELLEVERVVDGNGRYLVVEKFGAAAEIAAAGAPLRP